ncbi:S41 family peptidase [Kordiimonas marina]|uniref:S41 family peptidase n=1 Tax=Kordiimonas marina TaxID=2872312 RepID=UPI001FF2AEE3|nr:S41 family peptidase [Kordiimonas marina]MCJ9427677.1 PDZ domain-containing protein [Kordiimonas marina]
MKKTMLRLVAISLLSGTSIGAHAAPDSDWFTDAAISPDGKTVLVGYKGDIYKVPVGGGSATPLTINDAWEGHPVWSHDGKWIAFSSDRNGNLDVYVMPAKGGDAKRLTYNSANDIPTDFTADNKAVTFTSPRVDSAQSSQFPRRSLPELYNVGLSGGTPEMVLTIPAEQARWNKKGDELLYREEKSLESPLRKHNRSAFARDIWLYNAKTSSYKQLTDFPGGDHNPVWGNGSTIYYTSEELDDTFNVWKMDLSSGKKQAVTDFKEHPVRSLSRADNGTMTFIHHGDIYTVKDGGKPQKLKISVLNDGHGRDVQTIDVSGDVSDFSVSPSGKEVAFVARGEVFVTSAEFKTTKRVTDTPAQERSVNFSPDGKKLVYAAERGGKWELVEASLQNPDEKYFFASTTLKERVLYRGDKDSFQPKYSPDGKKVAFLYGRDELRVVDTETGKAVTALPASYNYSYADGDIHFNWSPDSKWLTVDFAPRQRIFITNIAIVPADGSKPPVDITKSGYLNSTPRWQADGGAVLWFTARYGMRDHGSWGTQLDVEAAFLTQDSYDRFTMSKEEYELKKELEDAKKKEEEKKAKDDAKKGDKAAEKAEDKKDEKKEAEVKPIKIDFNNLDDRTLRLTVNSSDLADAVLTKDGSKLYYLSRFEGGYNLWLHDFREKATKLIVKFDAKQAAIQLAADEKSAFVLADGSISKLTLSKDSAKKKPVQLKASMELKPYAERQYFFDHIWRQVGDKFYNPNMHGIDWKAMRAEYEPKLPSIGNDRDFARMMEEMLGELNASHTGAYYRGKHKNADNTAALGVIFDMKDTKGPLTIAAVLEKSPLVKAGSEVKPGMKLAAVDGVELSATTNLAELLNGKTGERVRLTFERKDKSRFDEVIKPISMRAEDNLLYERWVKSRRALVDKLSGGHLAYVHVRAMNDASFRVVYNELFGRGFDKDGVVVDTRWNGGGWLHNDLAKLLSGKEYTHMKVRGRVYQGDPMDQWYKPSIVVMGEGNYSDASGFPYAYKTLKIGQTVGMPVPGTMTAVWWEWLHSGDIVFGIPQVGMLDTHGNYLENHELEPDYKVKNMPGASSHGEDQQIEEAVKVLMKTVEDDKKK